MTGEEPPSWFGETDDDSARSEELPAVSVDWFSDIESERLSTEATTERLDDATGAAAANDPDADPDATDDHTGQGFIAWLKALFGLA